jgi:probable HAF family extracellular repeat protein
MVLKKIQFGMGLALLAGVLGGARERQLNYEIEILPVPPGCQSFSQLHGLGGQDRVIGMLACDGIEGQRAVLWDHGALVEIGSLGGPSSFPFGVSAGGEVVGTAETSEIYEDETHVTRPFLWAKDKMRDLGTLGGPLGGAAAVNAGGTVVGACQPSHSDPRLGGVPYRACVWESDAVRDIGDLGGPDVFANDVNGRGWVVGDSNTGETEGPDHHFTDHAFLYDGKSMRDLGTLGGSASLAYSIDEHGDVVGFSSIREPLARGGPFAHGFLWRAGTLLDLGTLGGPSSEALDINDQDQIVGWSQLRRRDGSLDQRAVLWERRGILDLNDTVSDSGGWVLREAWAIDESGRILANADREGRRRLVVLTPSPGPRPEGS